MKKYRIKSILEDGHTVPCYIVQVRAFPGFWVDVKPFFDQYDPGYAVRCAEELLEILEERP